MNKKHINILLLLAVLTISIFGLVMVYSSSYVWADYKFNDPFKFVKHQGLFFLVGIFLITIIIKIDYKMYEKYSNKILLICLISLVLVIIPGI